MAIGVTGSGTGDYDDSNNNELYLESEIRKLKEDKKVMLAVFKTIFQNHLIANEAERTEYFEELVEILKKEGIIC